ncbi:homogentisate phytyltransferase [Ferruginibacter sp. SUN106]|uniref:homogentisate phytyltransferase n=1 Tax=Ferruginibacter sp. SUN106 TaxID=2978348 RepID=UPI003D35A0AB
MKAAKILWQFSRPHTIIGSVCSITALYIIANNGSNLLQHGWLYATTLIAALACNVFIVGINQLADVEMDKINKPYLPLAAGTLSRKNALIIVYTALVMALVFALLASLFYFALIIIILLIGIAYSLPPLYLKQHHLPAALAITLVRGLLVNVGIFLHFQKTINGNYELPGHIWCLAFFIMAFSIAIAWFKDLPDTEGDKKFHVRTLAVLYSKKNALLGGTLLVGAAYIFVLAWSFLYAIKNPWYLIVTHGSLFIFFLLNYFSVKLEDKNSVKKFYLRFWVFFFAEYILFAVWVML